MKYSNFMLVGLLIFIIGILVVVLGIIFSIILNQGGLPQNNTINNCKEICISNGYTYYKLTSSPYQNAICYCKENEKIHTFTING